MRVRSALFITAGMTGALIGGAAIATALDDPDVELESVVLDDVVAPSGAGSSEAGSSVANDASSELTTQQVDGLEQLVGTLRAGEDLDEWYVSGVEVDFGPDGWISTASSMEDYDGDGTAGSLLDELRGLDGREITVGVRYELDGDRDRDDADAFTIEGLAYRDPNGAAAPWQARPEGTEATRDEVSAAAAEAVGDGAVVIEVDEENEDGWLGWDVEVRSADGVEFQVYVDLSGAVVDVRPDN